MGAYKIVLMQTKWDIAITNIN